MCTVKAHRVPKSKLTINCSFSVKSYITGVGTIFFKEENTSKALIQAWKDYVHIKSTNK